MIFPLLTMLPFIFALPLPVISPVTINAIKFPTLVILTDMTLAVTVAKVTAPFALPYKLPIK